MTEKEMMKAAIRWKNGDLLRTIAIDLGYAPGTLNVIIHNNRDLFPYRKKRFSEDARRDAIEGVLSGRYTVAEMAKKLDVHKTTVGKWVRQARMA